MTTQFMSNETLATAYGFTPGEDFDDTFSKVSIEAILLGIVATAIYLHEAIFDAFKTDVTRVVAEAMVPSTYYYRTRAKQFQPGVDLVYNETTQSFAYPSEDPTNQPITFAACRDLGTSVKLLVATSDVDGLPTAIDNTTLELFQAYMRKIKPAGVILNIFTLNPDDIKITATIQINRLLLNTDGTLVASPSIHPVEDAINAYLASIDFDLGVFNKTKCVDAIQRATGVVDVTLASVQAKKATASTYDTVSTNNYTAEAGCLKSVDLRSTLSYVV